MFYGQLTLRNISNKNNANKYFEIYYEFKSIKYLLIYFLGDGAFWSINVLNSKYYHGSKKLMFVV